MEHILLRAGLTRNESKVYITLLHLGSVRSGKIIKEVGLHRAAVYDTLDNLINKGLVSYVIKSNRKYFEAHDPERIMEYLDTKIQNIEKQKKALKNQLSKLKELRSISKEDQEGYVYKGKQGIKSICLDVLKERKPWLVFGSQGNFVKIMPEYFFRFHKKRELLGMHMKIIRNESTKGAKWSKGLKLREERFLPDAYTTPSTTYIFGDKVAIVVWSPDPMAFLIRSKKVADSYRKYFEVLWQAAKP